MSFRETLRTAFRSILVNRMRSFLTMLGIIIGVASVIALSSVGNAATKSVTNQVESLGSNLLTVSPGATQFGGVNFGAGSSSTLTYADSQAIAANDAEVAHVAPIVDVRSTQAVYGTNNTSTSLQGTTADYASVRTTTLSSGSFLLPQEVQNSENVAVLGSEIAQTLFSGYRVNPVGQTIDLNGTPFTVVGVLQSQGSNGFSNLDNQITIPITVAMNVFNGSDSVSTIDVSAVSQANMDQAEQEIESTLRNLHQLRPGQSDDFTIQNQASVLNTLQGVTKVLTMLLGGIAAISLLVGGIGIMNIMLVSVTERTREIGIRKAIGAKRKTVMMQFLVESVLLSVVGAAIGLILGGGGAEIVGAFMKLGNIVSPVSVILSVVFAMLIGIGFGVYPARKASRLNPIDALRYE